MIARGSHAYVTGRRHGFGTDNSVRDGGASCNYGKTGEAKKKKKRKIPESPWGVLKREGRAAGACLQRNKKPKMRQRDSERPPTTPIRR